MAKKRQGKAKVNKPNGAEFGEATLARLTSKIEQNLTGSETEFRPGKRKRGGQAMERETPKRQARDRPETTPKKAANTNADCNTAASKNAALLAEIRALGGDISDLELVAGFDSDDELGNWRGRAGEDEVDSAFRDELAKFASGLGLEGVAQIDTDTNDSNGHDEETEEDDGEEIEEENHESEVDKAGAMAKYPKSDVAVKNAAPSQSKIEERTRGNLMFDPRPDWHSFDLQDLPASLPDNLSEFVSTISSLKALADRLLEEDAAAYNRMRAATSSRKFMSAIMTSGTLSDKISALTLAVQESPIHNIKAFESLMTLAGRKNRGQAIAALGALVDLLGNGLVLPKDRRLRTFGSHPELLGSLLEDSSNNKKTGGKLPGKLTPAHLIMWAYEDWLKGAYFRVIQHLEIWCRDEVEYSRSRALDFVFGLLRDKPEQEANLLKIVVNKLGDRDRKIASRASHLLLQLLNQHPGMKVIVTSTIEQDVLLRPGQDLRTKYYAVNTLNQLILSGKEPQIADMLVRIYFDVLVSLLKAGRLGSLDVESTLEKTKKEASRQAKKQAGKPQLPALAEQDGIEEESAQKLVSSLLTGVNRAVPFTTTEVTTLERHLDTLFTITHSSNFNTSIQALMLVQRLASSKNLAEERFYRTLYESLLDPRLATSSKQALYLNLLFRSLKNDVNTRRVKAFVKRMLQVVNLHQPAFVCGVLFLVSELESSVPDLKTLIKEPEENDEDDANGDVVEEGMSENEDASETQVKRAAKRRLSLYDGRKRQPDHSNAEKSCLWELVPFLSHFHPSVTLFAANLLTKQETVHKPELASHTLMHFLDKFVYRNPKTSDGSRGTSIMQPTVTATSTLHIVLPGNPRAGRQSVVNSASFRSLDPERVAPEDVFFHEYFSKRGKPSETSKAKGAQKSHTHLDEEEGEDEVWEALVNSRPEVGDLDGDDSDMDPDGFDTDDSLKLRSDDDWSDDSESETAHMTDGGTGADGFENIIGSSDDGSDEPLAVETTGRIAGEGKQKGRLSRKELKSLPTFASAGDYYAQLQEDDEGLDHQ